MLESADAGPENKLLNGNKNDTMYVLLQKSNKDAHRSPSKRVGFMALIPHRALTVILIVSALLAANVAGATTWLVPSERPTIKTGIQAAAFGDTVLIACGTYLEHEINLKAGITLLGAGVDSSCVVIDAQNQGRVLNCEGLTELTRVQNLTFTGGYTTEGWFEALGGGVRCLESIVSFTNCVFERNTARIGAGLGASASTITLQDCTFVGNRATHFDWAAGGGFWARDCNGTIDNCEITNNSAFSDNPGNPGDGGGFFFNNNTFAVSNCRFEANSTGAGAGGFYSVTNDSSVVSNSDFIANTAANGGAVYFEFAAAAQFVDCNFIENTATAGGAVVIFNGSFPKLTGCLFEGNTATLWGGGAIDSWTSETEVTDCVFRNNTAQSHGGGANFGSGNATVTNSVFIGNTAVGNGGGMRAHIANIVATGCTLASNAATSGGGIYGGVGSSATIENCIVAYAVSGGSVVGAEPGFATISCTDIFGNDGGDWQGDIADQLLADGNFSADPLFCALSLNDVSLDGVSPCAPAGQEICGLIGAVPVGCSVAATPDQAILPASIVGVGNYPNPFNPATTIRFTLGQAGPTRVVVLDLAGRLVRTLLAESLTADTHEVNWRGRNDDGAEVAAGVYFYQITSRDQQSVGRMALVK